MASITRRRFLKSSAAFATVTIVPAVATRGRSLARTYAANERLNIACIGVGGRGENHVGPALAENVVAICDISDDTLNARLRDMERGKYKDRDAAKPLPKTFFDYRQMFDKMAGEIDAVVVATPDHHHAPASMRAMKLGKHVYCEKPLTHDIWEARLMAQTAREHKVATQMGNQGRADEAWRYLCEWVWAGAIGQVKEVHVWTDRPGIPTHFWWPQGGTRPQGTEICPASVHWDEFLGAAPERPYLGKYADGKFKGQNVYQPFVWRGWWDFGTGALGDIGCHFMSGFFSALKIEHAAAVELVKDSGDCTAEMYPAASIVKWSIPARGDMQPCTIYWYDGAQYPPKEVGELGEGDAYPANGQILVGEKGKLNSSGKPSFVGGKTPDGWKEPEKTLPRCESDHFREWVTACKGGRPAFSNFDHAGPLAEMVLLGNLALKAGVGKRVEWDGPNLKVTNLPELNEWVRRPHRQGWEV